MCRQFGGFYAPQWKRSEMGGTANQNFFISKLHSLEASLVFPIRKSPEKWQFATTPQSGIVNECCKRQCTLSTLVSYCAVEELKGEESLAEIDTKVRVNEEPERARSTYIPMNLKSTVPSIPFLGTTNRSRPVFVVLPQVHEKAK
ncbi:ilGF domain-containing protein [Trichonephila clavata]|uniref:IlGF domain-containing protein n=1 Tax=Trichonephila clavata TaxID=2740835 RepID=A0A8X6FQ95_TRICU|nr:ilGF domain-containing protein [Trichonephila clavata]